MRPPPHGTGGCLRQFCYFSAESRFESGVSHKNENHYKNIFMETKENKTLLDEQQKKEFVNAVKCLDKTVNHIIKAIKDNPTNVVSSDVVFMSLTTLLVRKQCDALQDVISVALSKVEETFENNENMA